MFHTFRRAREAKDVLYVQQFLGHKILNNTIRYIQLEEAIFKDMINEYICKVANTLEEAKDLIELGFSYVYDVNGVKLFRKPKHSV
jgi:hypothetical protein